MSLRYKIAIAVLGEERYLGIVGASRQLEVSRKCEVLVTMIYPNWPRKVEKLERDWLVH